MKRCLSCFFAITAGFSLAAQPAQQETQRNQQRVSLKALSQALQSAGCNPMALAAVLEKAKLKVSDLQNLNQPLTIDIDQASCRSPSAATIARSREILREDGTVSRVGTTTQAAVPAAAATVVSKVKLEILQDELASARGQLARAKAELAQRIKTQKAEIVTRNKLERALGAKVIWMPIVVGSLTAAIMLSCFLLLLKGMRGLTEDKDAENEKKFDSLNAELAALKETQRRMIYFEREKKIEFSGKDLVFPLSGFELAPGGAEFVGLYACPLCSERNLVIPERGVSGRKFYSHMAKCLAPKPIAAVPPALPPALPPSTTNVA